MNQNIWGPHAWFTLHTISFTYPIEPKPIERDQYKAFFHSFQHVLPCSVCKKNYIRHLKEYPIEEHLGSRKDLVYWVIDLHNMVNSETGKKVISYETAIQKYEDAYKKKIPLQKESKDGHEEPSDCDSAQHCSPKEIFTEYYDLFYYLFLLLLLLLLIAFLSHYKIRIQKI
jgi:hypothetical protein